MKKSVVSKGIAFAAVVFISGHATNMSQHMKLVDTIGLETDETYSNSAARGTRDRANGNRVEAVNLEKCSVWLKSLSDKAGSDAC